MNSYPAKVIPDAISRYRKAVETAHHEVLGSEHRPEAPGGFAPRADLPHETSQLKDYLSVSEISYASLGCYRGHSMALLDLARNPATRTVKTFASLAIVARAVHHIQHTGERIMIVTPSSANKATAMRDAVFRAIRCGLVNEGQLGVAAIVPVSSHEKLWQSDLFADSHLQERNPLALYTGPEPSTVKLIARDTVLDLAEQVRRDTGINLWYTLELGNYVSADVIRAFAEAEFFPPDLAHPRLHAHAVSSAFGLLGHARGHQMLHATGKDTAPPHYFLVQHLGAADMVLSLYHGTSSYEHIPVYRHDSVSGLFSQDTDPHFPATTYNPTEVLDRTFYTRSPSTSEQMNNLIHIQGGGGVVVSLHECLGRYSEIRALLAGAGYELPADPRQIREWSLVMAMTGVLNGIDRGLISEPDILVHCSGSYTADDYSPIPATGLPHVTDLSGFKTALLKAVISA